MDEIRILQLGNEDWNTIYTVPKGAVLDYEKNFAKPAERLYDIVFLDRTPREEEIEPLRKSTRAYTLFATEKAKMSGKADWLFRCKKGQAISSEDVQEFLQKEVKYYYPKPYGEKFNPQNFAIAQGFDGMVRWKGNYSVDLYGEYGEEFSQIAFWRNNIPVFAGQVIDLWLEYRKGSEVEISLEVTMFAQGSLSEVIGRWVFDESTLSKVVQIGNCDQNGVIFVSLHAKGRGALRIIALHDRYSRGSHGYFLPGGERYVTSVREEIFCYFDPGDLKPPLNVYFSGYKTAQGFEGYYMMRRMGCPFLLVAEPRLEGGSFYMGSEEYERLLSDVLKKYIRELGFSTDQVIFSGLSMGTYGALYYGCDIRPHALLLGKPLASIGNVAANEKYLRPGGFPTSLDVLLYLCGNTDADAVKELNRRLWDKFDAADWSRSKFIVSYMLEDDYDTDAYETLISHLQSEGTQVYGKGIHGRHNDNTDAIVTWFMGQYERILNEDFGRRIEK